MNKFLKVFARKEMALALAGAGVSTLTGVGGYFFGKKRERERILALYAVENLKGDADWQPTPAEPYFGFNTWDLPVKESIDKVIAEYGPNGRSADVNYAEFEREATPLADEILGKIEVVEPEEYPDDDWSSEKPEVVEPIGPVLAAVHNIFAASSCDADWDYDEELANRSTHKPYVIHQDEFINQDSGYDQSTLTYFAKDGVVVDELNSPLEDWVSTLGQLKFGHGTTDANAVYIRNDKLQHEFEVLLSTGAYLDEVIGQEAELEIERDEIKHSMNLRMRRE